MTSPITALTPIVKHAYRHGYCYELAVELMRRTGLAMAVLVLDWGPTQGTHLVHAALDVNGRLLDVSGWDSRERTLAYYAKDEGIDLDLYEWRTITGQKQLDAFELDLFRDEDDDENWQKQTDQRAREVAQLVLAAYPIRAAA